MTTEPIFALPFISGDLTRASAMTGLSVSVIQQAVRDGDLVPSYQGRKPIFLATELHAWIASLPTERRAS